MPSPNLSVSVADRASSSLNRNRPDAIRQHDHLSTGEQIYVLVVAITAS
jgi:hypothetical protein